jgi:hypothetical protein
MIASIFFTERLPAIPISMTVRRLPCARETGSRVVAGEHDGAMAQRPVSRVRAKSAGRMIYKCYQIVKDGMREGLGNLSGTFGCKSRQMHKN